MIDENLEEQILNLFQNLPRKPIAQASKDSIWLKINAHITAAKSEVRPRASFWDIFLLRNAWGKVGAIVLIVLIALSLVSGAARATPGQTLYSVKKAAEKMEIALATNDQNKVKITIKHAKRRLEEVQVLVSQDRQNGVVSDTLNALTDTTQAAVAGLENEPTLKNQILELTTHEEKVLTAVQSQVQGEVKEAVEKALTLTKESLTRLNSEEAIQGTSTTAVLQEDSNAPQTQATSTATQNPKTPAKNESAQTEEGTVKSKMQIHGIIKISDGQGVPVE
ncbi:MAG: DUF5667 domain-containing protein [bacterium]|nr:DUF5667 domain-containing protein [bacterium]